LKFCYNHLQPKTIAETGCGTGPIIDELSKEESVIGRQFNGYDIPLRAIELAEQRASERIRFFERLMR
jgi:methylase of polypeptide subunit release factors